MQEVIATVRAQGVGPAGLHLHDDRGQVGRVGAERLQRNVAGLQRVGIAGHHRRERRVDARLDLGHAPEAGVQLQEPGALGFQLFADFAVDPDVGAAEPIDRLLRIADDKGRVGGGAGPAPARSWCSATGTGRGDSTTIRA